MSAGQQPTVELANGLLTAAAIQLHTLMSRITDLHLQYSVKRGASGLQALSDGATLSASDAADIVAAYNTLGTIADIYFGRAAQPAAYVFDDALASARGGQAD
jgi:hypothetical protein